MELLTATNLSWGSVAFGIASAACWARAALVKISDARAVELINLRAQKSGQPPNYACVTFDGFDLRETWQAQTFWNAAGAGCATSAILLQAIGGLL